METTLLFYKKHWKKKNNNILKKAGNILWELMIFLNNLEFALTIITN
jgi:hypothetical protein